MGLSHKGLSRLEQLKRAGLIGMGSRMLEFGSQNIRTEHGGAHISAFVYRFTDGQVLKSPEELEAIAAGGTMASLMKICGVDYLAIDIFEAENTILFDLNTDPVPDELRGKFDLVTNFGTSEHIIDQYHTFKVMHEFTKPGGVMYHDLPMGGYFYHGYFSYTPLFFHHLALANGYEIFLRHFSKVSMFDHFSETVTVELSENGWPDRGYHDVGIEFIFRKMNDAPFHIPVDVATSLDVDREFVEGKRPDGVILSTPRG